MTKKPFFSIIIPTYNRAYIISQAIESVLNQNFKDWELIIVDDGSTDNTYEVVKRYLRDKRISYFKFDKNMGVNIARNFGIKKAMGMYIIPLDSDTQLLNGALDLIFNILSIKSDVICFFHIENLSGKKYKPIPAQGYIQYKDFLCELFKGDYLPIVRRDYFINVLYYEDIKGGEGIVWKRIIKKLGGVNFYPYKVLLNNDLLEDRLSIKRKNFKRLSQVFKKDLEIFGKDYLKYCPKLFFEKLIKQFIYSFLSFFS